MLVPRTSYSRYTLHGLKICTTVTISVGQFPNDIYLISDEFPKYLLSVPNTVNVVARIETQTCLMFMTYY